MQEVVARSTPVKADTERLYITLNVAQLLPVARTPPSLVWADIWPPRELASRSKKASNSDRVYSEALRT